MEIQRRLVLDANILIRAVLGRRVRQIITDHTDRGAFFAPAAAYAEARRYLPTLLDKRSSNADATAAALRGSLGNFRNVLPVDHCSENEPDPRSRSRWVRARSSGCPSE